MENIQEKIDTAIDSHIEGNVSDNSQTSQAPEQTEQQVSQPVQGQEDWDYTKDARWNKMWKDPKDVYKSYRNLEKEYETIKPIKSEYETIKKTFQDNGLPMEQLNDYINQYKQLADPENPRNKVADFFAQYADKKELHPFLDKFFNYIDKPEYQPHIQSMLNDIETRENQKLFPNMNAEQIAHFKQMEEKVSSFEQMLNTQKQEQLKQELSKELDTKLQEITKYAESRGLTVTDEMKAHVAKYCLENGYPIKQFKPAFIELYGEQLESTQLKKHEESILKKLNQNNKNVVPSAATKNQRDTLPKGSKIEDIVSHYMGKLGGVS